MPDDAYLRLRTAARHVGVLLPWANQAVEEELPPLGRPGVVFYYARLVPASRTTAVDDAFWHGLRAAAEQAVDSLRHLPLESTVLACTSAGFSGGPRLPTGVVTAFDALTTSLTLGGHRQIVLATPYPERVTQAEADALHAAGITVLAHVSLGLADGYPDIGEDNIVRLVQRLPPGAVHDSTALVLSCTGWRTFTAAACLREMLHLPVLTSNSVIATYRPRGVIA